MPCRFIQSASPAKMVQNITPSYLIVLVLITSTAISCTFSYTKSSFYDVVFGWKEVDFQFKSFEHRRESLRSGAFIPENNVIGGMKVSGERIFLAVGRFHSGVPATLNYVPYSRTLGPQPNPQPLLIPYPSWELNEEGNCFVIQYVQSMEIDQYKRMWVLDVGRRHIFDPVLDNKCPPKLVLIDLTTDKFIHSYEFPADVVGRNSSWLNDLVVGCTSPTNCMAYISDSNDAKIVVYDLFTDRSWFVQHPSMEADPNARVISIQGKNYPFMNAVNGIALSSRDTHFSRIYYTPLSSYNVFSIASETVKEAGAWNQAGTRLKDSDVIHVGVKESQTDGMTIDANGVLYYGILGISGIKGWNTGDGRMTDANQVVVAQNDEDLQWLDSFSICTDGYLFGTFNRLQKFIAHSYDFTDVNFRVVRIFINSKNYMHSKSDV